MNPPHLCRCGKQEVEFICVSINCAKNRRFLCLFCRTYKYEDQITFINKFQQDGQQLIQDRTRKIEYLYFQFKLLCQSYQISNQQKEDINKQFEKIIEYQERLNQQQNITFQEIYDKITEKNGFLSLTEKEIKYILMARCLQNDNDQLPQMLNQLQNIEQLKDTYLLLNLRLIIKKTIRIKQFEKNVQQGNIVGNYVCASNDIIYWTTYNQTFQNGQLYIENLKDVINFPKVINVNGLIDDMICQKKNIFLSVYRVNQLCQFIRVRKKNIKQQFKILFKFDGSVVSQFKILFKNLVVCNYLNKGKLLLFCVKKKKIISIIKKRSKIIDYLPRSNSIILVENQKLNFYNLITKKLKIKIQLPQLEGKYEYITERQQLITCQGQLRVYKLDYQNKSCSIIKSFEKVITYVYKKEPYYLILFKKDNEIIIFDLSYTLIKRIKWQKFQLYSRDTFIVNYDVKFIFLRKYYFQDQSKIKIYRCQVYD